MTVQRAAVAVVSILVIAWLAVSYDNARVIRRAQIVAADRQATPARIDTALSDLSGSRTLDPANDAETLSYRASLEGLAGHPETQLAELERLVRIEPDTAEAWFLIAELTQKSDPARSAEARAELHRLDPLGAPAP